jgi:tRNA nucleotidyltransferase (CCA-adding enzyme)
MDGATLIELLERSLEPGLRRAFDVVVRSSEQLSTRAWLAGGPIRDLLMGRPLSDLDFVFEGDGISFAEEVAGVLGGKLIVHERFGTARVEVNARAHLDIASARQESYPFPGALPKVVAGDIDSDLKRRDFTINAMALPVGPEQGGSLLDPLGGSSDIQKGHVRVLHEHSFTDDPTRILRAERFAARFGFAIEEETESLMHAAIDGGALQTVSPARLGTEVILLLKEEAPEAGLTGFERRGLWSQLLGESWRVPLDLKGLGERVQDAIEWYAQIPNREESAERWIVWWLCLVVHMDGTEARRVVTEFQMGREAQLATTDASRRYEQAKEVILGEICAESALYEALDALVPEMLVCLASVLRDARVRDRLDWFVTTLRATEPWVTGQDLQELGVPETSARSDLLRRLLHGQLDGRFTDRDMAIAEAKREISTE